MILIFENIFKSMKLIVPLCSLLFLSCNRQNADTVIAGSADKMNVLYMGIDNPVDIAVAGVSADKIKATVDEKCGSIEGKNGKYIVKVKNRNFKINVYKVEENNKEVLLDSIKFRIKTIPAPVTSIAGITGDGRIDKDALLKLNGIEVSWGDLVFEMKMPIVSYTLTFMNDGKVMSIEEDGPALSDMMKKYIAKMEHGQKLMIEDVIIKTPEGRRKMAGIVLKVN